MGWAYNSLGSVMVETGDYANAETTLLEARRIQGFDESVLSAIFESLAHFNGHTQEIVYITRLQLGGVYRFLWIPSTPEQIASD